MKKIRGEDLQTALDPKQFCRLGSDKFIDISTLDESDPDIYETIFYKEVPAINGNMDEIIIVTLFSKIQGIPEKDPRAADIMCHKNDRTAWEKTQSQESK